MSQTNLEKLKAMFAAFGEGDFETVATYLHPDLIITEADCLPYSGVFRGPEGYIELATKVFATWDDLSVSQEAMLAEGDLLVVVSKFKGKTKAGVSFTMPMTEAFYFTDGLVSEIRPYYFDTHKLAELYAQKA